MSDPGHKLHTVFGGVRQHVAGACEFCANAFEVKEQVREADVGSRSSWRWS